MFDQSEVTPRQKQVSLWTAGIFTALGLIFLAFSIYIVVVEQQGRFDLSDTILMPVAAVMMIVSGISYRLIRSGRHMLGTALLFFMVVLIPPIAVVLLLKTLFAITTLYMLFLSIFMIVQVLPRSIRWHAVTAAAFAFVIHLLIELWDPPFRVNTNIAGFTTVITVLAVIGLLIYTVRLAWTGTIRVKLITFFSVVAFISVAFVSLVSYLNFRSVQLENIRSTVRNAAALAALQQNGDELLAISSADDPLFEKINQQNLKIRRTDPRFVFVWTASKDENGLYFLVDAGVPGEPGLAEFRERYDDASIVVVENYDTMTGPIADDEIYTDEYGSFISGYAPVFTADGKRAAVIGVDINATTIVQEQQDLLNQTVLLVVFTTLFSIVLGYFLGSLLTNPINKLTAVTEKYAVGDFSSRSEIQSKDEVGALSTAFNDMADQIQSLVSGLEQRVAARTQSLELAADVGRSVSQVRELDTMLKDAAELIRSRFDLYYVQVYLIDPNRTNLILRSGTGSVGQELLIRSHRLPLLTTSINGRAAIEKRSVVVEDTATSSFFKPNPLLPETRSEMAIPLLVGERVVGVLDLQSKEAGALNRDVLTAFEALAGQLAIAVQNASYVEEIQQTRAELEKQARRLARTSWSEYLDAVHKPEAIGFVFEGDRVSPLDDAQMPAPAEGLHTLAAPIEVIGEGLGQLVIELEGNPPIAQADLLVKNVARQVAQQIENIRLLETTERSRAEAEMASRRLTQQGWKDYTASLGEQSLGYAYNLTEVQPVEASPEMDVPADAVALPLTIRSEAIGQLMIKGLQPDDTQALDLAKAVADRLAAHIESLRQQDQTQLALQQTEKLSAAGLLLSQATDMQEILKVVVETMSISAVNRALLGVINYDDAGQLVEIEMVANWWSGRGSQPSEPGTRYNAQTLNTMPYFVSQQPAFANDTFNDERITGLSLDLVKHLDIRSLAVLPLFAGGRQIGVLLLECQEQYNFTPANTRLFISLAPQIATVLENRRQFERAQKQAERQSMLNLISQKIQSATSVEAVLQIAARELGRALGAPRTIAQLSIKDKQ